MPDTRYYKIGEVCKLLDIQPHVLRYWEKEFPQINPKRISNQRLYSQNDIELINKIKDLLYDKKLTIEGVKKVIKKKSHIPLLFSELQDINIKNLEISSKKEKDKRDQGELLYKIKQELIRIKEIILNANNG